MHDCEAGSALFASRAALVVSVLVVVGDAFASTNHNTLLEPSLVAQALLSTVSPSTLLKHRPWHNVVTVLARPAVELLTHHVLGFAFILYLLCTFFLVRLFFLQLCLALGLLALGLLVR